MKKFTKFLCLMMAMVMLAGVLVACDDKPVERPDALVVMSEAVDGLFNPYYATTGADMDVVGMTQIGMLSTGFEGASGKEEATVAFGDEEPVVAKDFMQKYNASADTTTYTYVLKNGITFSDGKPLTINDVLFNMYVYLDPVYAGSSTMYSTDIVGLQEYRTQQNVSSDNQDSLLNTQAVGRATDRRLELINLYRDLKRELDMDPTVEQMENAIADHTLSLGYMSAVDVDHDKVTTEDLLNDYKDILVEFEKELNRDFESAKESYIDESPYKEAGFDEILAFMYMEGFVELEYAKKQGHDGKEIDDKSQITKVTPQYSETAVTDKASAVKYVYESKVQSELDIISMYWNAGNVMFAEYISQAKDVILQERVTEGELAYANISGIVSLGHSDYDANTINVNGTDYTVAKTYNADGTTTSDSEYAVLEITINGVDPKAVWNFGFTVAPHHYYSDPAKYPVDIANNEFGVEWGSFEFMKDVIQAPVKVGIPVGAGPYVATNINNEDNPKANEFDSNNVVYFKANPNFLLGEPKIEKLRYQVVNSSNAIAQLSSGNVHFITPQFTSDNIDKLAKEPNVKTLSADSLGYGYIGINAGHVKDVNIRRAIMSAMDTAMALEYYSTGTAQQIVWPMSTVSWAYPKEGNALNADNGHDYAMFTTQEKAIENIKKYMALAGVTADDKDLSIKFTIAGSTLEEHPTFLVFKNAADLLNSCGWDIEVAPDTNGLNKLSTGALEVWAAAWGSTIDPDMYQVYHKDSGATSVKAWGYDHIKTQPNSYEYKILSKLSTVIDDAREIDDRAERTDLYEEAMGYVLDLAVELPVYQRENLYAYNSSVINPDSLPAIINPYTSPLAKIWEVELVGE